MSKENKLSTHSCNFYIGKIERRQGTPIVTMTNSPPQYGVFFDGTGNNLYNDSSSFLDAKEPTNIAKLYLLYNYTPGRNMHRYVSSHYEPGIGTTSGKADSQIDMGIAHTFDNHLNNALIKTKEFFKNHFRSPIGIVDVFGFSRGAALARAFVNEIHKINSTKPNYWGLSNLQIRFVGLFDTVASILTPGDNFNFRYNLNLHPSAAHRVFHITAYHEEREYFPLTSILNSKNQSPANHFEEIVLPGAHSDIGGGYGTGEETIYYPLEGNGQRHPSSIDEKEHIKTQIKRKIEHKYWRPGINISVDEKQIALLNTYRTQYVPKWVRFVKPQLAHVSLNLMHQKAKEAGVPMSNIELLLRTESFKNRDASSVFEIPTEIANNLEKIKKIPYDPQFYKSFTHESLLINELYKKYIHHSAKYAAPPDGAINPDKPESKPEKTAANGIREIFYNDPRKGFYAGTK